MSQIKYSRQFDVSHHKRQFTLRFHYKLRPQASSSFNPCQIVMLEEYLNFMPVLTHITAIRSLTERPPDEWL